MLTNFTTVWCFYNNFYIIIIYLLLSNLHFIFLSSARTAPEPGHSRLIDPGHNRIKVKVKVKQNLRKWRVTFRSSGLFRLYPRIKCLP